MIATRTFRPLIDRVAAYRGLPPWTVTSPDGVTPMAPGTWLEGLVLAESAGKTNATRYEAHQDRAGRADSATDQDAPGRDDGFVEDDKSYGLMQVMGYNVKRLLGVDPATLVDFRIAFDPETNLMLGTRLLVDELTAVGFDVERALARYNGGPTGDDRAVPGGAMRVQAYVNRVRAHAWEVRKDRIAVRWPA